ncbi:MarR family winged helix-turn-helix transcriptional regulator [Bradyrhizobium cenepequi]|uniref:MarR family winged helix-turn-helix transcriptional regulator n=1 Tax=Bradyrhizobium cenepequi TaxID=2821403 RepID=UPI001CE31829|nr:MarR family winged helix-turn-helix transcriptional regulator [Bradyrhizobium cenepequi]MCA6108513.1 winged helix-turn-helix transcriptional regulator [Bradyrhizobium cenepequi]
MLSSKLMPNFAAAQLKLSVLVPDVISRRNSEELMLTKTRSRTAKTNRKAQKPGIEPTVSIPHLMADGSDPAFRHFIHDTLAFSARLQAVRSQLGTVIGLSGTQYTVLLAVAHLSGKDRKIGVNQVAEHLHLSGAFVTMEINKLVARGLVRKHIDSEDRRRVILAVSPKGRALLSELAAAQRPVNDMLFRGLSASDFKKLRKLMSGMVDAADEAAHLIKNTLRSRQRALWDR